MDKKQFKNPTSFVDKVMAPYSEQIEVPEYKTKCWCIGRKASKAGTDVAQKKFGNFGDLRDEYWKLIKKKKIKNTDKSWAKHIKDYVDLEKETVANHPKKNDPNPKCEECNGTGIDHSTYNQRSKWDWYVIGGRWDGKAAGIEDKRRKQSKDGGFNFGDKHHQIKHNHATVDDLIKQKIVPLALITPDGEWNESGKMGWFGIHYDKMPEKKWEDLVMEIYKAHPNHYGVGLDCHI